MVQVIGPGGQRGLTTGQKLAGGVSQALQTGQELYQQHRQRKAMEQLGLPPDIDPQLAKTIIAEKMKGERPLNPLQQSQLDLNRQRIEESQSTNSMFNQLLKGGEPQQPLNQQDNLEDQQPEQTAPSAQQWLKARSDDELKQGAAYKGQPGKKGIIGNMFQSEIDRRQSEAQARTKKEGKYFEFNEPELKKIADTERKLDIEDARYGRMEELFSDPSKFPSSITAAFFTKDGQLSDIAYSQLSPEAQEAVKLIIDSTSNIKDTYGARVTNFDLQTYLRKLPSLLNSPEGRMRVLRDLRNVNSINQLYNRGIQEVFDDAGGSDKISFSEADKKFKKKYGEQMKGMLTDFARPEKKTFNSRPDPAQYLGKRIKDSESGEVFISDGKEWKPVGR